MTFCTAIFRSRSQAIDCKNMLQRAGIKCRLVPTPSRLKLGCGVSVEIAARDYARAKRYITSAAYGTFYAFICS